MLAEAVTVPSPTDWIAIGKTIGEVIVGIIIAYTAWKAQRTSKTVEVVHKLTNSTLGENLKIGAIAARTLAINSKLPEHEALAEVAENKVKIHMAEQARVDAETKL